MKKYILVCLVAMVALQACKKDNINASAVKNDSIVADSSATALMNTAAIPSTFIYKLINKKLGYNKHFNLDVNADGTPDYSFTTVLIMQNNKPYLYLIINPVSGTGNKLLIQKGQPNVFNSFYTYPLKSGSKVQPTTGYKTDWNSPGQKGVIVGSTSVGANKQYAGLWANQIDKYLGIKFYIKGKAHYGWVKLSHIGYKDEVALSELAYNNIAEMPILAAEK
ncbi:hypothetical protein FFF34_012275 [Inquilinus sp. KBS0705]|nr:hypothetical protein FFF34_012275 [Inquilinus sp. KBS0705]